MKAIQKETIICHSNEYFIFTEPLYDFLKLLPKEHVYHPSQTADWRGYYTNWEIKNKQLYLFGFTGYIVNHEIEGIEYLFPNQKEVFANWYSGDIGIRIPKDDPTENPSDPFDYYFLKFLNGIHIGTRLYEEYEDNDFNEIDNDSYYGEAPF